MRIFIAVLHMRYEAVPHMRCVRCQIFTERKENTKVSCVRYEKSRSVKQRYSDSAMSGTLRALLSLKSIIRDNKGVWLSSKVFWWAIGIFELAVCLAIYFGGNALIAAIR